MDEIEHNNKVKILEELQKNGRASVSDIAKKIGISRQTVAKIISKMEKKKEIWGYTAIFNPELVGKKPFMFLLKLDLSINTDDFLKKVTSSKLIKEHEEKYGVKTSMFLHGDSDVFSLIWTKDIIEAKKLMNNYKIALRPNLKEIYLYDILATFRNNGIANPKMVEEWDSLII